MDVPKLWDVKYIHIPSHRYSWFQLMPFQERRYPKFVSKDMEDMYIEELRSSVNLLMANLESLPVSKGGPDFKQKLKRSSLNSSFLDMDEGDILSKSDVVLSFTLEVCVCVLGGGLFVCLCLLVERGCVCWHIGKGGSVCVCICWE